MRISDWSSDVCSSDLLIKHLRGFPAFGQQRLQFDPNASYASSASRTPRQAQRWHNPPVPLPSTTMHPHNFLRCLLALCVLFALPASAQAPPTASQPAATPVERLPLVVVHQSPSCGCCTAWAEHMLQAGFPVDVRDEIGRAPGRERVDRKSVVSGKGLSLR